MTLLEIAQKLADDAIRSALEDHLQAARIWREASQKAYELNNDSAILPDEATWALLIHARFEASRLRKQAVEWRAIGLLDPAFNADWEADRWQDVAYRVRTVILGKAWR